MNNYKNTRLWYLSGGMTKFGKTDFDLSNEWRLDVKNALYKMSEGVIVAFNPNEHFSMVDNESDFTDREAMNLDIYKLRNSELVIYSNNDPLSRGSMIELGIAWERQIPIITLNEDNNEIHPWLKCFSEKIFTDREDMLAYLRDHYICID